MSTAGRPPRRYQIGTVAEMTGLSIQTLRHWDEVGLVPPSQRSEGGFRLYSDVDVQRLLVIRRMRPLEFTLEQMGHLLDSIDLLAQRDSAETERTAALEYIRDCHRRATDALHRLRKRLAYAEELTEMLARLADLALGEAPSSSQADSG
jgi:MerR family transcriptional regulator, copper efflux regulator